MRTHNCEDSDMIETGSAAARKRRPWKWTLVLAGLTVCVSHPVALAEAPPEELMAKGKKVYESTCVLCHQPTGMGLPDSFPPLVAGSPFAANAAIIDPLKKLGFYEDGKMVLGKAETQIAVVLKGMPGTRMFGFGHVLKDEDVAAVVTYIRNAWGNNSGDIVKPEQVQPLRK